MKRIAAAVLAVLFLFPVLTRAADFDGDSREDVAVFRPANGLWAIRGVTRAYFGGTGDDPRPGDYNGDGIADIAINRDSTGLWAVKGVTRVYFGASGDTALPGGGGQRTYDYVVKPGDGDDLERALESDSYDSVFIPVGTYSVNTVINVDNVARIVGESKTKTRIEFSGSNYMSIEENGCRVEGITFVDGGSSLSYGSLHVSADYVSVDKCRFVGDQTVGLGWTSLYATYLTISNCYASVDQFSGGRGFYGATTPNGMVITNCQAYYCGYAGFQNCSNLSSCYVSGGGYTDYGFRNCNQISSCFVVEADLAGFYSCDRISGCSVIGASYTDYGFQSCGYISSSSASGCNTSDWQSCIYKDPESCN